jgi:hypothetical protein
MKFLNIVWPSDKVQEVSEEPSASTLDYLKVKGH